MGQLHIQPRWTTANIISRLESERFWGIEKNPLTKSRLTNYLWGKPTYSVGQEVGFIGACQDLMLSKPLHVEATKLPSSETLGVKHSGFENLASFTLSSKSQDFQYFRQKTPLKEESSSSQPPSFTLGLEQGKNVAFPHWALCMLLSVIVRHIWDEMILKVILIKMKLLWPVFTNLDIPNDLTVALSDELNLHLSSTLEWNWHKIFDLS